MRTVSVLRGSVSVWLRSALSDSEYCKPKPEPVSATVCEPADVNSEKCPLLSLVLDDGPTVTVAPGTGAPDSSCTVPE